MVVPLFCFQMRGLKVIRFDPSRLNCCPPSSEEVVDGEQDDGSDHGHDEASGLAFLIEPESPTDPSADDGSGDSEQHCDDETTRVFSGHDEFGDGPHDEADQNYPKPVHSDSSPIKLAERIRRGLASSTYSLFWHEGLAVHLGEEKSF